jgi:hypothetical protein
VSVHDLNGTLTILALCEGNKCLEATKEHRGNGRIIVMQKHVHDGVCIWETVRKLVIPPSADFLDYSDIALDEHGHVAITSQEDSQVWIGQLNGKTADGNWDIDNMEFDANVGEIYDFPKNEDCEVIYCNIEGVYFIDERTLLTVSDKAKGKGKQDPRCAEKDQSVHIFTLP